jgi:protein SCO1/2
MPQMIQRRLCHFLILGLMSVLSACTSEPVPWQTKNMTGYMPELSFALTDANHNKIVTGKDFDGQIVALNFGFTHCPDVCPMSLHQLQSALSKMDEAQAKQVQILFATVDPQRDGVPEMKAYTENFGRTIGLTGDRAGLIILAKRYKVGVEFGKAGDDGHYDVSHSSVTYVFDRQGAVRLLIRPDDTTDAIAADLARLVAERD